MIDPPRKEAASSVKILKKAGVKVAMITGDYKDTAFAIARKIGIADSVEQCMTGAEIDRMSQEAFRRKIRNIRVFARVTPAHKVKIVKGFQEAGQIVAMTGDGVNDAPSLQAADIGIAMGAMGSDAAIEAADVVLMDDDPARIALAMDISRRTVRIVYQNIVFALAIKAACLALGALGLAGMWLAIFADVGVMVLAVLNATRALYTRDLVRRNGLDK